MARTSVLDQDPKLREEVAKMVSEGTKRPIIADHFNVHPDTITRWVHRPDVQALIQQYNQERINRIVARVDTELERRLERVANMEVEDILKVRKELLPHRIEVTEKVDEASVVEALLNEYYAQLREASEEDLEPSEA